MAYHSTSDFAKYLSNQGIWNMTSSPHYLQFNRFIVKSIESNKTLSLQDHHNLPIKMLFVPLAGCPHPSKVKLVAWYFQDGSTQPKKNTCNNAFRQSISAASLKSNKGKVEDLIPRQISGLCRRDPSLDKTT